VKGNNTPSPMGGISVLPIFRPVVQEKASDRAQSGVLFKAMDMFSEQVRTCTSTHHPP
jgi:hypothetical protein